MTVDNFELIKQLLVFESEDDFYHLQILKRKKDCAEHEKGRNNNARCIKTYYIRNREHLDSKKDEIISLCKLFKARAYINLNKKSYQKSAMYMLREVTDRIIFKQYEHIYRAYDSVIGSSEVNSGEKRWIVDIDNVENVNNLELYKNNINSCRPEGDKIIAEIPTKNGIHLITRPFNIKELEPFQCLHPFDIQKNNPTLLYFDDNE